jgi:2-polyprenyl-3-methyl-5-hydroxy-6-metoxy-1,4-benzoquinol methylase
MLNETQASAILPNWQSLEWYYSVEISPGVYTKGMGFNNIAVTRKMLANINLEGKSVIDIGAMEGAVSTLIAKRGAKVLAVDGADLSDRVMLVKRAHGVQFSYCSDIPLHRYAERIFEIQASKSNWPHPFQEIGPSENTNYGFDVVLSSGVMYHVLNPFDHLITYRKLCKLGGLVVIEAAVAISDEITFFHGMRPEGMLYRGFSSWFVSTSAMDVFLRACFLEPLAFCYVSRDKLMGVEVARVGVVARAVSRRAFNPKTYARYREVADSELFFNPDFSGLHPAAHLTGHVSNKVSLKMDGLHTAENGMSVSTFDASAPLSYTDDDLRFPLSG